MTDARYLRFAFADARLVELRIPRGDRWISGVFDNADDLRRVVAELAGTSNFYTTLNTPANIEITNSMTAKALRDEHISTVVRLPFDFDPVREKDTASTDEELQAARRQRDRFVAMLSGLGWPWAAVASSGNGGHALFRCRVPNNTEFSEMLITLYRGLAQDFTTAAVIFDSTVRNASRIWRLYGTVNRKGTPTPERPHRMATIAIPSRWEGVSPRQIESLATRYARKPAPAAPRATIPIVGAGDYRTLDVAAWFAAHQLYKRPIGDARHAVYCPWQDEHTTASGPLSTDTVIWSADGDRWPTFHCSHAHCDGRSLADVMALWRDADAYCGRAWQRRAA